MRTVFQWVITGILIIIGFWAISIYGELYRAHTPIFLFLWLFLPLVALLLNFRPIRSAFSVSSLKIIRGLLVAVVVLFSFGSFSNYDHIRDALGERFVDGYAVRHYEVSDEYGRAAVATTVSTIHWYSRFALWFFEWIVLALCAALPYVTWRAATRAVDEAIRESSQNETGAMG